MFIHDDTIQLAELTQEFTLPNFAARLPSILTAAQATPVKSVDLAALHNNLLAPFQNGCVAQEGTDRLLAKVAAPQSAEAAIATQMLTYGYCSHYATGDGPCYLSIEDDSSHFQRYTFVASYPTGTTPLLLGTLQMVIGSTVPALEIFIPEPGRPLPHRMACDSPAANARVGELRRFSVNPLLEAGVPPDDPLKTILRDYRSLVYRKLYELSLHLFGALEVRFVYGIATPEIYRFFTRSGMTMYPLAGMRLAETAEVRRIQRSHGLYWRPHAPLAQQPALYQIHLPTAHPSA